MKDDIRPNTQPEDQPANRGIHPPINSILDALTFQLARFVAVNEHAGSAQFQAEHGLSLNEWRIIGLVHALNPATVWRLRKILLMDRGLLSRTIKGLKDRGLILSQLDKDDARAVELTLTSAGRELHEKVLAYLIERNEVVVETLSPEECREFLRILKKMAAHTEALSELTQVLK